MLLVTQGGPEAVDPATGPGILIVDRHLLFLAALRRLLVDPPLNARVTVSTRSDAVLNSEGPEFDVVLCDIRAGPLPAHSLPALLAERRPRVPVVLLGETGDEALLAEALDSGATGFFTKGTTVQELVEGIRAVLAGHVAVGEVLAQTLLVSAQRRKGRSEILGRLSPAETKILMLVGRAESIKTMAALTATSQRTVRNHLASIYRKLNLRNRSEVTLLAVKLGLADPELRT
jgi:DNA-binding NarL/FixJ family response regulator